VFHECKISCECERDMALSIPPRCFSSSQSAERRDHRLEYCRQSSSAVWYRNETIGMGAPETRLLKMFNFILMTNCDLFFSAKKVCVPALESGGSLAFIMETEILINNFENSFEKNFYLLQKPLFVCFQKLGDC
jgi:hypothetical protein